MFVIPREPLELRWLALLVLVFGLALFLSCGGGLFLARKARLVRPVGERVLGLVTRAHAAGGIRLQAVLELDLPQSQIFAYPQFGVLLLTSQLGASLEDEQLELLLSRTSERLRPGKHPTLRHLLLPLTALALVLGPMTSWISLGALLPLFFFLRLNEGSTTDSPRTIGGMADRELTYLRALERIHESNGLPVVLTLRPASNLYDRMTALGAQPAYDRPQPPAAKGRITSAFLLVGLASGLCASRFLERRSERTPVLLSLALFGPSVRLGDLGVLEFERDPIRAADLFRAALLLEPDDAWWRADLALTLATLGRCEEARTELAEAERRGSERKGFADLRESVRAAVKHCDSR